MQTVDVQSRKNISETVFVPRSEAEYKRLAAMLDNLIDEVGEDETHPLASLMDVLSALIENYENANVSQCGFTRAERKIIRKLQCFGKPDF
jgi:HTH-type transcriptional regulator / antitoxin HigA